MKSYTQMKSELTLKSNAKTKLKLKSNARSKTPSKRWKIHIDKINQQQATNWKYKDRTKTSTRRKQNTAGLQDILQCVMDSEYSAMFTWFRIMLCQMTIGGLCQILHIHYQYLIYFSITIIVLHYYSIVVACMHLAYIYRYLILSDAVYLSTSILLLYCTSLP